MPNLETVVIKQLRLLTEGEVANVIGVRPKTLQKWRAAGEGPPHIKVGKRLIKYRPGDVAIWMQEHSSQPDSSSPFRDAA